MSKTQNFTKQELLEIVKAHAREHYEEDGWDLVVECYSDEQILKALGRSKKKDGAIWAVQFNLGLKTYADHRSEVQATAW